MAVNPLDAISAYTKQGAGIMGGLMGSPASAAAGGGESFSDMLSGAMGDVISTLHAGEKASISAVTGKSDMTTVAAALDNAEVILDEVTSIRDKIIAAYQAITSGAI